MSNIIQDISTSGSIVSGVVLILALIAATLEFIIKGIVDPQLEVIVGILATTFIGAVTGERVAKQVAKGDPILPINGLGNGSHKQNGG